MEKIRFRGIMPALYTPLDENENLITPTVARLMDYQYSRGVNGFYVGGATGEGPVIPAKTRIALCEAAMDANRGRGDIILHVGGPNFSDVKTLIAHANTAGVNGLSAMAPNAYFAHTDRELIEYYKRIASLTDKPVLIYVTPLMLGNNLRAVFEELISVENIIGLKFTQPNYYLLSLLKMINGGNINIINGPDETLLCGLSMGAEGGIGSTYNIMPERYAALYKAFTEGRMDDARAIQYSVNRVIRVLLEYRGEGALLNGKMALRLMGFDVGECAFPMANYGKEEMDGLAAALREAGLEI